MSDASHHNVWNVVKRMVVLRVPLMMLHHAIRRIARYRSVLTAATGTGRTLRTGGHHPICPWPHDSMCRNPYCLVSPACPACCSRNACIRGTTAKQKLCQHKRCKHMLPKCPSCCNSTPGATCLLLACGYPHCRN